MAGYKPPLLSRGLLEKLPQQDDTRHPWPSLSCINEKSSMRRWVYTGRQAWGWGWVGRGCQEGSAAGFAGLAGLGSVSV